MEQYYTINETIAILKIKRTKLYDLLKLKSERNIPKIEEDENIVDFYSDNSFQKFLDDNHLLSESYEATDIVKINSDFTTNDSSKFYLRKEAAIQFADMARAFSNAFDFKAHLTINSAWRSQAYQRKLASNCSA